MVRFKVHHAICQIGQIKSEVPNAAAFVHSFRFLHESFSAPGRRLLVLPPPPSLTPSPSEVYCALSTTDKDEGCVALKIYPMTQAGSASHRNEVNVYKALPPHPSIPKFIGEGAMDNGMRFTALEYVPHPNLKTVLKQNGPFTEEQALNVVRQLVRFPLLPSERLHYLTLHQLSALNFLRNHCIAHQDIKPSNILVDPSTLKITLLDFSLAVSFVDENARSQHHCGTLQYRSPQILARAPFNPLLADVWSAGLLYWELLRGASPFAEFRSEADLLHAFQRGFTFEGVPQRSLQFLQRTLKFSESERATLSEALRLSEDHRAEPRHAKLKRTTSASNLEVCV